MFLGIIIRKYKNNVAYIHRIYTKLIKKYQYIINKFKIYCVKAIPSSLNLGDSIIFYVPNSFTPNGDQFNNGFYPVITSGVDEASYELLIYDRWGELVFETNTTTDGWDGTYKGNSSQDGTYTWKIKFKSKYTDQVFEHVGHVVLLK